MTEIAALAAFWGTPVAPPILVAERENRVFSVTYRDGRKAALRLHRPGYRSRLEVLAELNWTEHLAKAGFPCPMPLRAPDGAFLPETGPLISAVAWLPGAAPSAQTALTPEHAHALGKLLAQFHKAADAAPLTPPDGPGWTMDSLLGPAPRTGSFTENPTLSAKERALLQAACSALQQTLPKYTAATLGFIHADPLRENLLETDGGLALIDFDDCGWGLRGHDLGSALIQTAQAPGADDRAAAMADGYGNPALVHELPAWTLLRALTSCGWAASRLTPQDPRVAAYAGRATSLARLWLDQ